MRHVSPVNDIAKGKAVEFVDYFVGKWLTAVDAKGRVSVPAPLRKVIAARTPESKAVLLSRHARDQALTGYDRAYLRRVHALLQQKRDADIAAGRDTDAAFAANGTAFGSVEETGLDGSGRIILPPGLRRRAGILDQAMFVGVGETFEVWSLDVARSVEGRPDIRDFAEELIAERDGRL
jgi:MraZ protein